MNKLIIHDNKTCQFISDDEDLIRILKSKLSYKTNGVEYTQAYKNGWSGITYLINKKGYFFSGLLFKVQEFLKERHVKYDFEDLRDLLVENSSLDISEKLKSLNLIPRDYQERIVNTACSNRKGIVRAATGSGKSLCMALITARLNKPTIIYVIGLDLLKQFHDLFSSLFNEPIGFIGNGICNIERINIASIWTIGSALKINKKNIINDDECNYEETFDESQTSKILDLLKKTNVHVCDESHIITTETIQSIHKNIDPEYIFGFSGTPYRDDNTDLLVNGILGEQIIDISASELIEKGVLAKPIIKFEAVPHMSMPMATYQSVYKTYVVENDIRNNLILKNVKLLLEKGYTPLVLFKQIKHGNILFDLFKEAGIKCEMLYGNDSLKRRTEVKESLNDKKINVILASTIFDLGIDIPMLNGLVLCGGGVSKIRSIQRIGRVIRKYPGKKFAAVIDFYDQIKYLKKHSTIRYYTYCSENGFKIIKCKEMSKL